MRDVCPSCKTSLTYYKRGYRVSRVVAVEIHGPDGRVPFWRCPDCGHDWHASEDASLRARALPHMNQAVTKQPSSPTVSPTAPTWHQF